MIPVSQAHLKVAAATHPGSRGKNNEDRYAVSAYRLDRQNPTPALLAVIADGIGGHRAGEIAAEMAVENISRIIAASDAAQPVEILRQAMVTTSQAIFERALKEPALQGMGTTCACAWVIDQRLFIAAAGDSRIYLVHAGAIQQLSTDHTWVQEALETGVITPDQAQGHPNAHVIRRFLGSRGQLEPDLRLRASRAESDAQAEANQGLRLAPGDCIILCTDGLTDLVGEAEILSTIQDWQGQAAIKRLIELANQRGGHDNITIVFLSVPESAPLEPVPTQRRNKLVLACLTASLLVFAAAGLLFGNWLLHRDANRGKSGLSASPSAGLTATTLPGIHVRATLETSPASETPFTGGGGNAFPSGSPSPTVRIATLTPWPTNTP